MVMVRSDTSGGSGDSAGDSSAVWGSGAVIERGTVCVWVRGAMVSAATLCEWIDRLTPVRLRRAVVRVRRVVQRDGVRRFDVIVDRRVLDELCDVWREQARQVSWRVKPHVPFWVRNANLAVSAQRQAARVQHEERRLAAVESWVRRRFLAFATWNVNQLARKKADIEARLLAVPGGIQVVALQETMRTSGDWNLRIAGYQCVERRARDSPGARGVALCVRSGLQMAEVGPMSDFCVFARVTGFGSDVNGRQCSVIFGSVYVPPKGEGRRAALAEVHRVLATVRGKFADEVVIAMGDFNMTQQQCGVWAARVRAGSSTGMAVVRGSGNMRSRFHKRLAPVPLPAGVAGPVRMVPKLVLGRDIDNILVSAQHGDKVTAVQVDRSFVASDHWAVRGKLSISELNAVSGEQAASGDRQSAAVAADAVVDQWRFARTRPLEAVAASVGAAAAGDGQPSIRDAVREDGRWSGANPFAPLEVFGMDDVVPRAVEQQVVNDVAAHFAAVSREVAREVGWVTKKRGSGKEVLWQAKGEMRCALARRAAAFKAWRRACKAVGIVAVMGNGSDDGSVGSGDGSSTGGRVQMEAVADAWQAYQVALKAARAVRRRLSRQAWLHFVDTRVVKLAAQPGRQWAAIKSLMGRGRRSTGGAVMAMWDVDDSSAVNVAVEDVCAGWQRYFERCCRGGDDPKYKSAEYWRQFAQRPVPGQRSDGIPEVNERLKWSEVCVQLRQMAAAKAPGPDGIPVWWLQLVVDQRRDGKDPEVPQSSMGRCLFGLLQFMWTHSVIPEEYELAEVVPIFKKGDVMDRSNYRPISLMHVALKVLCGVVKSRFEAVVEGVLPRAQGGFRKREECVAQVVSLYDAVARRKAKGMTTVLAFWDMKRAYDSVPHLGLMMKLRRFGFSGRFMAFIEALYAHPKLRVRVAEGVWTDTIDLLAGVRQGDIPSPGFFNFFIMDLSAALASVPNPCVVPGTEDPLVELLFADDLATAADGPAVLGAQIEVIERWCEENDMWMNVPKCAVMVVAPSAAKSAEMKAALASADLKVHGCPVSVVDSVVYLGLLLHESWDVSVTAKDRAKKGQALVSSINAFLTCTTIPLSTRSLVIRTVVIPTMLYGCELWGSTITAAPVQKVVNSAMRATLHCSSGGVSVAALSLEMGIAPVFASVLARKLRLRAKAPQLRTWISTLTQHEWGRCWSRKCLTAARRHGVMPALESALAQPQVDCSKAVYKKVIALMTERCYSDDSKWMAARSAKAFRDANMKGTSLASPDFPWVCELGAQLTQLARSRCGWLVTTCLAWAPGHDRAVEGGLNSCPFCRGCPGAVTEWETVTHVWVRCVRWSALRDKYGLTALISWCREFGPDDVSDDGIAVLLQGGSVQDTALKRWVVGKDSHDSSVIVSVQGYCSDGEGIDIRHSSVQAALFLSEVQRERMIIIKAWSKP